MPDTNVGDVLVHYKGRYYCFDANAHTLSEATQRQEEVTQHAVEAGAILARLERRADARGEGCVCYVVDVDAVGVRLPQHGSDESGQLFAFNAGQICAFDPESLEPRALSNATAKSVARAFDTGVVLGSMVHADEACGMTCTLINANLPAPESSTTSPQQQYTQEIVFHYEGRYYAVDPERSHCAAASGALLEAAKHAVTAGTHVGVDPGGLGIGSMCVVVDLSALSRPEAHTDPVVVLKHGDSQTQTFDLASGRVRLADEQLRARVDESFSAGSWLARIPTEAHDLTGMSCQLVDLSALRRQRK